jgi:hypothetical protein
MPGTRYDAPSVQKQPRLVFGFSGDTRIAAFDVFEVNGLKEKIEPLVTISPADLGKSKTLGRTQ